MGFFQVLKCSSQVWMAVLHRKKHIHIYRQLQLLLIEGWFVLAVTSMSTEKC